MKERSYRCECGETDLSKFYKTVKNRCKVCQDKSRLAYAADRKRKNKEFMMEYMGNKCSRCGYSKCRSALEVHHLDPSEKSPNFNNLPKMSRKSIKKELDKCILLCANCHREEHHPDTTH